MSNTKILMLPARQLYYKKIVSKIEKFALTCYNCKIII